MEGDWTTIGSELSPATAPAEREAAQLRDRLAEIEVEYATLETELAAFNGDYLRVVVTVMAELHEIESRVANLVAERSGSSVDAQSAREARTKAQETTRVVGAIPPPAGPAPTGDLKRLFRDAAKVMHPDLADDESRPHAEAFMKRLNRAYRAGDADAIQNLVRQWEASPFSALPEEARAARRSDALRGAVERAQQRLEEKRSSELAHLMEQAMAAAAAGHDLLAEMRRSAEIALATARARLAELEAGPH
jgi:predicted  nucleic acid-binding Zn-ribbon protein